MKNTEENIKFGSKWINEQGKTVKITQVDDEDEGNYLEYTCTSDHDKGGEYDDNKDDFLAEYKLISQSKRLRAFVVGWTPNADETVPEEDLS